MQWLLSLVLVPSASAAVLAEFEVGFAPGAAVFVALSGDFADPV